MLELLVGVGRAGGPLESLALAGEAQFLREEVALLRIRRGEVELGVVGTVEVLEQFGLEVAPRRYRGERDVVELVIDLEARGKQLALLALLRRVPGAVAELVVAPARVRGLPGGAVGGVQHARELVHVLVADARQHLGVLARVPQQREAHVLLVLLVDVVAAGEVPDVAVAALHGGGEAHRHVLAERGVVDALDVAAVVIAAGHLDAALGRERGPVGDDVDRAARGVAPEQRALRALEHLDALDVDEGRLGAGAARGVHAIDVDRHGRVGADGPVVGLHAADAVGGLQRLVVVHVHAGREATDVGEVARAELFQRLARIGGDRDRHVHDVLGALLRRDDDLLDHLGVQRLAGGDGEGDGGAAKGHGVLRR